MNKHIYIYSPASAVRDRPAVRRGVARLKSIGYDVEIDASAFATHMRFAGDDETRLAAIHRSAASGAGIAMITRGGFGLTRLLPGINYKAVGKAIDRGTRFVGLSDFTAFQAAVLAKTGAATWAGPAVGEDFGVQSEPDDIMQSCFDDMASGQGEGVGWRLPRNEQVVTPVAVKGLLWGGNLAVLAGLAGTPWMPGVKGGLLFLEDVHEHPYRIERLLTQLLYAGVLSNQKAVILGYFTNYKAVPNDKGYRLGTVVDWLRGRMKTPVFTNLPFGHVPTKVLLPVGAKVHLSIEGRDAFLLWGHRH